MKKAKLKDLKKGFIFKILDEPEHFEGTIWKVINNPYNNDYYTQFNAKLLKNKYNKAFWEIEEKVYWNRENNLNIELLKWK